MVFAKRLRERVVRGEITCSVRISMSPHVKEGRRYRMGDGEIEIDSVTLIGFQILLPRWRESQASWACLICSKWQNTVRATTSI